MPVVALSWSGNPVHNQHRWLWVPAQGGDDEEGAARRTYSAASIHSAAPRHSVSRCSGRKKPKWPILATPVSAGVTVMISGLIAVNPEHSNSTAGRVAQGS